MGSYYKWSDSDIETLRKEVANNKIFKEIALLLGTTTASVKSKAFRLGIKGATRTVNQICPNCKKKFERPVKQERKYCCKECKWEGLRTNPIKLITHCLHCNKKISKRRMYCSTYCEKEYKSHLYIKKWKRGIVDGRVGKTGTSRYIYRFIFKKYKEQCSRCGWKEINKYSGRTTLELEHKDGNFMNNKEENLDLLCPNCHSLTPFYRHLNNNNGRKSRLKAEGKL